MPEKVTIEDYGPWVFLKNPANPNYPHGLAFEKGGLVAHLQELNEKLYIVVEKWFLGKKEVIDRFPEESLYLRGNSPEESLVAVMNTFSYPQPYSNAS